MPRHTSFNRAVHVHCSHNIRISYTQLYTTHVATHMIHYSPADINQFTGSEGTLWCSHDKFTLYLSEYTYRSHVRTICTHNIQVRSGVHRYLSTITPPRWGRLIWSDWSLRGVMGTGDTCLVISVASMVQHDRTIWQPTLSEKDGYFLTVIEGFFFNRDQNKWP